MIYNFIPKSWAFEAILFTSLFNTKIKMCTSSEKDFQHDDDAGAMKEWCKSGLTNSLILFYFCHVFSRLIEIDNDQTCNLLENNTRDIQYRERII